MGEGTWMQASEIESPFPLHDLNCGLRMFDRKFAEVAEIKHRNRKA
jgi:hypothetical protein